MKKTPWIAKIAALLFGMAGLCAAGAAIWTALFALDMPPVLVKPPADAQSQVCAMLDQVCAGDFEAAGTYMLGSPGLGADRDPTEPSGQLLWEVFVDSLSYQLLGDCYATDDGISQDVRITALKLESVTADLRQRTQDILRSRQEAAADVSQIYDENNNFREEVVMDAYLEAVTLAIREDGTTASVDLTVRLAYDSGQWWVIPEAQLLEAISGGILK